MTGRRFHSCFGAFPAVEPPAKTKTREERALELLHETLTAWEGEEDSVQEEHADHIAELKAFLKGGS